MAEPLIPSAIIANLVKEATKPILQGCVSLGKESLDKLKVILDSSLSQYLERAHEKYSKTKTLLYRDKPVNLKNFYVRTNISINNEEIEEDEFFDLIKQNRRVVITGTAGSGKSTFCKSIFIDAVEQQLGIIPIFIELRHLNTNSNQTLLEYVVESLKSVESRFSNTQLEYALKLGKILFIFDGFDEIDGEKKQQYEREIINISNSHHHIMILISSRPDPLFHSWEEFHQYRITSLSKEKCIKVIEKLEYDKAVKEKFLHSLSTGLYEKHRSFASNPLLLTMMLLTYEQIAEIPNKIHLFYEQAFLTLFNKHDSLKSLYKRKSATGLPLDDFKKVTSAFCTLSYSESAYYFSESEIMRFLKKAIQVSGIKTQPNQLLIDLLDSVCIMQRDGLSYTFTHRSFQEYFTATFLVNLSGDKKFDIFNKIASVSDRDIVFPMILDINSDLLEREWIIPKLRNFIEKQSDLPEGDTGRLVLLSRLFRLITRITNNKAEGVGYTFYNKAEDKYDCHSLYFISRLYDHELARFYKRKHKKLPDEKKSEMELLRIDLKSGKNNIDLSNIEELSKATKIRLIKSGCTSLPQILITYAKAKLAKLERKHNKKQEDLASILLS